jgi:hypothetical protein
MLPAVLDSVPSLLRSLTSSRRRLAVATSTWVFLLGCSSESPSDTPGTSQSSGGSTTAGGMGGAPSSSSGGVQAIGGGGSGGAPVATPTGGGPVAPTPTFGGSSSGGAPAIPPAGGSGGSVTPAGGAASIGGVAGGSGGAGTGGAAHVRDHCIEGYAPLAVDATMKDGYSEYTKSNQVDTLVQPEVIDWMESQVWQEAHFQWHNIRRCNSGMVDRTRAGGLDPCKHTELVPENQEGKGAGDGLEFLAMHRHMIQSLKQLFPKHTEQFEGWDTFPTDKAQIPAAWQADWRAFDANMVANGAKADNPGMHMSEKGFESEGAFGQWIQTTSGLHGALHFKWVRTQNSEHGLGNQFTNIDNYMFWKMHGWIDKVWDKYRAAKGQTPNDPDIKEAVLKQCREMDDLALLVDPTLAPTPTTCTPAPIQTGFFVDKIRPIFESGTNKCTGCHGKDGAGASLTLGGSECVKSSDIVAALVGKPSKNGGQFKLIEPGDPMKSWLYLKVTNKAAQAGCTPTGGVQCNTALMPQGSPTVTLTAQEQADLEKWIMDGAPAPQ